MFGRFSTPHARRRSADARSFAPSDPGTARIVLAGLATGLGVACTCGALLLAYLRGAAGGLPAGAGPLVRDWVLQQFAVTALAYAAIGALVGVTVAVVRGPRTTGWLRVLAAIGAVWAGLAVWSILFSPTSLAAVPRVRDWPIAAVLGTGVAAACALGALARVRWVRFALAQAVLALPCVLPDPGVKVPPAAEPRPDVILLGIDNVDRSAMAELARRIGAASTEGDRGVRYLAEVVSPVPLTRLAWSGIMLGRNPSDLLPLDTLDSSGRRALFAREPFVLTRHVRDAGYRSTYVTDDAATSIYLPGEAFDAVEQDAVGWQVGARRLFAVAFPLAEAYLGRWMGTGISNAPGGDGTWRVFRDVARALEADADGRPRLVAAHAVALHGVIRPTMREVGGPARLLSLAARDLRADDPLSLREGGTSAGPRSIPQSVLYERRQAMVVDQAEALLRSLERAGHRRRSLIVVFSDHGELFFADSTRNLPGLHGLLLEPRSVNVGALVLLPTEDPRLPLPAAAAREIRGPFPLHRLASLVAEFADRHAPSAPASGAVASGEVVADGPAGGWLRAVVAGDSLPRTVIPVRSGGRPSLGNDRVYEGRRTFTSAEMRSALRLGADGRLALAPAGVALLDATSDFGWTDGSWLLSFAPLQDGGFLAECWRGSERLRVWRAATTVAAPSDPASLGSLCTGSERHDAVGM